MSVRTDHSQFLTKEYVVRKCHVLRVSSTYLGYFWGKKDDKMIRARNNTRLLTINYRHRDPFLLVLKN